MKKSEWIPSKKKESGKLLKTAGLLGWVSKHNPNTILKRISATKKKY